MTQLLSREKFVEATPETLEQLLASGNTCVVEDGRRIVGAFVSPEDYEIVRQAKAQRLIAAMEALQNQMASVATPEELDELIRELDTNNS